MRSKREKRQRYQESPYALWGNRIPMASTWRKSLGHPETVPLLLEIGCGKGEFSVFIAEKRPEWLIIGMDRKAERLQTAVLRAETHRLPNLYFWHGDAQTLHSAFAQGEVQEIWLNYPDPYPKARHAKHRLIHPRFIWQYEWILSEGGLLHIRTDDEGLYYYAQEQLHAASWSVEQAVPLLLDRAEESLGVKTEFYLKRGGVVRYLCAKRPVRRLLEC
ncbi:MAG: tRNA (guanosine(46)-N7)-methyltransferase TrmB [Bacteroidia bacterium]|nr:tRNA (guanosine(46)-N7)-methyltransferase TrmB [Bacteroidia bacterium]MDW8235073.1 tRNA (guanosine(46)-N7)-methyltransferase TrmB [Bacteroidia bacterium]